MTVKIVSDSVSDIPSAVADELGITVVPLNVVIKGMTYRDGVDISTDDFYRKLAASTEQPTTSTPVIKEFTDTYARLAPDADGIIVITIGRKLSACGDAAKRAVDEVGLKCPIIVIPSDMAMMAEGLLAIAAAKAAQKGATLDELVELTRRNMGRSELRIAFDTLKYLERGGRIGKAQSLLGSIIGINPILGIKDGEVFPFKRERSRIKAFDSLCEFVAGFKHIEEMAVEDATTPEEAEQLVQRLGRFFPVERIYRSKVSPVIGTNVGPRAIGVAVLGDR